MPRKTLDCALLLLIAVHWLGGFSPLAAFAAAAPALAGAATAATAAPAAACTTGATALCLDSRFLVTAAWVTTSGSGNGTAVALTADTGYFWFFDAANVEVVVKVLDACSLSPRRFWVFAGGLTNVEVKLTVQDTATGTVRTYTNPQGQDFVPIQDANAFATCGTQSPGGAGAPAPGSVAAAWRQFQRVTRAAISMPVLLGSFGSDRTSTGRFDGPEGIALDGAGNVYVADGLNARVQKFNPSGQFIAAWGTPGTGNGQFSFPIAVAVSPQDQVLVLDTENGNVQVFSTDGQYLSQFGSGSLVETGSLAVGPAGDVYVSNYSSVYHFAADGALLGTFGTQGTGPGQLDGIGGMVVAANGDVLVLDYRNLRVERFTAAGQYVTEWGSAGTGPGQFDAPDGLGIDAQGNVYETEAAAGISRVQKFTGSGQYLAGWGSFGTANGQLAYPLGVAVGPQGTVYVVDHGNDRVETFSSSGQYQGQWGSQGAGPGEMNEPQGLAVDGSGAIYVADTQFNRVQELTAGGRFLAQFGSFGSGDGQLMQPAGVAVDAARNVYVADSGNGRIAKFGPDGSWQGAWALDQGGLPGAIAIDAAGSVYVADVQNERIVKFDGGGHPLTTWGSAGKGAGQFSYPAYIAIDGLGRIYVADAYGSRVEVFEPWGQYLQQIPLPGFPQAITIDPAGDLIVATSQDQIYAYDPLGNLLATFGSQGTGVGQFRYVQGIVVDAVGRLFVSDSFNSRVTRYSFACSPTATSLCLDNGRFRVTVRWQSSVTAAGAGMAVPLTADTGYFWFFAPSNVEVIAKVLNGCALGNHYWLFAAGLTNVGADLIVEDTQTGVNKAYTTAQGQVFAPILDTGALASCP